jgi:hypothetical protein
MNPALLLIHQILKFNNFLELNDKELEKLMSGECSLDDIMNHPEERRDNVRLRVPLRMFFLNILLISIISGILTHQWLFLLFGVAMICIHETCWIIFQIRSR